MFRALLQCSRIGARGLCLSSQSLQLTLGVGTRISIAHGPARNSVPACLSCDRIDDLRALKLAHRPAHRHKLPIPDD